MLEIPPYSQIQCDQLGKLLCDTSYHLLWLPRAAWAQKRNPNLDLVFRIGRGRKTYHRKRGNSFTITFGVKTIYDKIHSPLRASLWLSTREIIENGYFSGTLTPANVLVHTACHEFAHFIQELLGQRQKGSVHNEQFYKILDKMHSGGHAGTFLKAFKSQMNKQNYSQGSIFPNEKQIEFNVGDHVVTRNARNHQFRGRIIKLNKNTVTVEVPGSSKPELYRVPHSLLTHDTGLNHRISR